MAHISYLSLGLSSTTVLLGNSNRFSPEPGNGQPTVFESGRNPDVFQVPFDGTPLVWSLGTITATASANDDECAPPSFAAHVPPMLTVSNTSGLPVRGFTSAT